VYGSPTRHVAVVSQARLPAYPQLFLAFASAWLRQPWFGPPAGCIGGGGQPRSKDKEVLKKRQQGIYSVEERLTIRRSYESPVMQALYNEWLGQPGSHEVRGC